MPLGMVGGRVMNRFVRYGSRVLSVVVLVFTLNAQTTNEAKLVGKWKLNIAKSQSQGAPRPVEATLVISEASASHFKWHLTEAFANHDRGRIVWKDSSFDGAIDGQPYEYKGAGRGSRMSFVDNNGILEGTVKYQETAKHPDGMVENETIAVSADGNTMTAQSTLTSPEGTESWNEVWERVPDKKPK